MPRRETRKGILIASRVEYVKREIDRSGWKNTTAIQTDAMDTKLPSSHYTHVFFEFGPFVLRDSSKGLQECHRMLKPDGMLSTATWQYVPWIDEFKPVFKNNPEFPPFADGVGFMRLFSQGNDAWETPEAAKRNLEADGFVDVESKAYVHVVAFSVEDVISALPAILSMIQNTLWTQEQRVQYDAPVRQAIEALLVEKYGAEGMIPWSWEAVVATGRKPS
jgi:SAM-dependent methyltransferase